MRRWVLMLGLIVLALPRAVVAQADPDWADCVQRADPTRSLRGCDAVLRHATRTPESRSTAHYHRGEAHRGLGDLDAALRDYNEAIRLNPRNLWAIVARGNVYRSRRELDAALRDYSEAIRLDPHQEIMFSTRAVTHHMRGDLEAALKDYDEAIRLNPHGSFSLNGRGLVHERRNNLAAAAADFERAAALGHASAPQQLARVRTAMAAATAPPAAAPAPAPAATVTTGRRVALVLGKNAYRGADPLANAVRDAELVASSLSALGFEVTVHRDLDRQATLQALQAFEDRTQGAAIALIYFAGHGVAVDGQNWLLPVDARLARPQHLADEAISLDRLVDATSGAQALQLVVLDACRDNPFGARMARAAGAQSRSIRGRGLEPIRQEALAGNVLVAFAAGAGRVAQDGPAGSHSPFALSFARRVAEPVDVRQLFGHVRDDVRAATGNEQLPAITAELGAGPFILSGGRRR